MKLCNIRRLGGACLIAAYAVTLVAGTAPGAGATGAQVSVASVTHAAAQPNVTLTLRALDRLHGFGYTINTPPRADRAIRHWQHVNGLVVDGIVGAQTSASLGLDSQSVGSEVGVVGLPSSPATPTTPARRVNPPQGSVQDIIRNVWPDELEDRAVAIATRESNLQPEVINANRNATGLFQIMWTVHRGWLCPQLGICNQQQLQDANLNATAAYALYQRADDANGPNGDGWGPWAL